MKPRFVIHALRMLASYDGGLSDDDCLADANLWKRELARAERQLVWAVASRPRLKIRLVDTLGATRCLIQQSWSHANV